MAEAKNPMCKNFAKSWEGLDGENFSNGRRSTPSQLRKNLRNSSISGTVDRRPFEKFSRSMLSHDLAKISRASRQAQKADCKGQGREILRFFAPERPRER